MASLGFPPPQFSDDRAWLPPWLQHPQLESLPLSSSSANQTLNGLANYGKDAEIFPSGGDGRFHYNSCHLFFSAEDANSQYSVAPSSGNVLHLHLHLSSDGDSVHSQSQCLNKSQAVNDSSKALPLQLVETSASLAEAIQSKMDQDGGVISPLMFIPAVVDGADPQFFTNNNNSGRHYEENMCQNASHRMHCLPQVSVPTTVENSAPPSVTNFKDPGCQYAEKCNVRHSKDAVSDAVELSISACEALVIHEFMRTGSDSDALPLRAIVEAALHIKQARLENSEDVFRSPTNEVDDTDFLSDLDDSVMEDAFLDVGLFSSAPDNENLHDLDISLVKDTPVLENYHVGRGSEHLKLMLQHKNAADDSDLNWNPSSGVCLGHHILPQSAGKISQNSSVAKPPADVNLYHACSSKIAEEQEIHYVAAGRFRSRWLGGWAMEEGEASANLKQNSPKSIPKFFVNEKSFLSESADVAPDESSSVQKHEMRSHISSRSSILFEGLHDKADERILISQEVRSSDLSSVDPLCSVVPCSITLENTSPPLAQNQNDKKADAESCFSPKVDIGRENFQKTSHQIIESICVESQAVPRNSNRCSGAPFWRCSASLKAYSILLSNCNASLEGEGAGHRILLSSGCVRNLLSSHHEMVSFGSNQRNFEGILPFRSVFESTVDRNDGENQDATFMRSTDTGTVSQKRTHDRPTIDGVEMKVQPSVQRKSPLILNQRPCCHPQDSELFADNLTREKVPEQDVQQKTSIKLDPRKNVGKTQLKLENSHGALERFRKRVCFAEAQFHLRKPQLHQDYSTFRANKKAKCSRTRDVKSCFTSHTNDVKRLIFYGLEFLLTGFSFKKEKEIVELIQIYGGMILLDIPSPNSRVKSISRSNLQQLPVVICSKKLQTTKFLYGCAVNALILKLKWLTDSVASGSIVSPEKYMIISNQAYKKRTRIGRSICCDHRKRTFDRVGFVLHGKQKFCTKFATIVKHGGGQVFKTLQSLVLGLDTEKISMGTIVAENESWALRHLRHCASERKIPMVPASWIVKSLHLGKLIALREEENIPSVIEVPRFATSMNWSQEI